MSTLDELLRSRFVDGGRDPATGLDCYGLLMAAAKVIDGRCLPDFKVSCFASAVISGKYREALKQAVKSEVPERGDVVALAIDPACPDTVQHFGIMWDSRRFLHTLYKTGPLLTKINDPYWGNKIKGTYKWNP